MKNWAKSKLNGVCKIGDGNHSSNYPKSSEMVSEGVPFIRANNMVNGTVVWDDLKFITTQKHEMLKKGHLKTGDILFTNRGEIGKIAIVGSDFNNANLNSQIAWFRCFERIDNRFLFYFLLSPSMQNHYSVEKNGAALQQFTIRQINEIEIPLPPLQEQQRIVAILDEAFSAIAKAKANAEQNFKNAKELFESYLQGVFDNKGEGWEVNILKEVCELKSGTTISPTLERTEGDVLYTKVGDMNLPDNEVEINTSSRFVNSNEIKLNQIIPEGAVIFPKRGGAIATNKKRKIVKPTIVDLNTMAIIPSKKLDNDYFFHWFQLFDLNSISNGANIPQINNYSFDEVYIPYPKSIREQQSIVQKLDALSLETNKLEAIYNQKLNDLEELKKSVLQKAFSGELKTKKVLV